MDEGFTRTGEPIWPIEERPVPQSDIPGEQTSPTQPFPTAPPPFARQSITVDDINPYLPEADQEQLRELLGTYRNEGLFTPPSFQGTIELPGHNGGANCPDSRRLPGCDKLADEIGGRLVHFTAAAVESEASGFSQRNLERREASTVLDIQFCPVFSQKAYDLVETQQGSPVKRGLSAAVRGVDIQTRVDQHSDRLVDLFFRLVAARRI